MVQVYAKLAKVIEPNKSFYLQLSADTRKVQLRKPTVDQRSEGP